MNISRKQLLLIVGVCALLALAGCSEFNDTGDQDVSDIEDSVDANATIDTIGESYYFEVGITESNQKGLVEAQPPFIMEKSLERENLIRRYQYLNDQNNQHHVYLLSHDGKVISYEIAQGKVSSVNSKLTNDVQIVRVDGCEFDGGNGAGGAEGSCFKTVESPQMDGSYGTNGDAIFFFTPEGDYVEWNGLYVVSEEPKDITTQEVLVDVEDDEGNDTDN